MEKAEKTEKIKVAEKRQGNDHTRYVYLKVIALFLCAVFCGLGIAENGLSRLTAQSSFLKTLNFRVPQHGTYELYFLGDEIRLERMIHLGQYRVEGTKVTARVLGKDIAFNTRVRLFDQKDVRNFTEKIPAMGVAVVNSFARLYHDGLVLLDR